MSSIKRRPKGISLQVLTGDAVTQAIAESRRPLPGVQETPRQELCRRLFGNSGDSEHEEDEEDDNAYFRRFQRSRELYFKALAEKKLTRKTVGNRRVLIRMVRE